MAKWNADVGLQLTIDYDDIEADTEAEAILSVGQNARMHYKMGSRT